MSIRRELLKNVGSQTTALVANEVDLIGKQPDSRIHLKNTRITVDNSWNVIVVGGGPEECTAAISAARDGVRTLLIKAMWQLGGMGTSGMIPAWCPFGMVKIIYPGLAEKCAS